MKIEEISKVKNLKGKRVLLRVDFNVPMEKGKIKETFKIEKSLATIFFLIRKGAKVVILSHLGRPKGKERKFSLKPVARQLEKMLSKKIFFLTVTDKDLKKEKRFKKIINKIQSSKDGSLTLLENVRFLQGEKENDSQVAKILSQLGDIFVLDGFGVVHRDSATVSGLAKHLPSYAGLLLTEEIKGLSRLVEKPKRPYVAVIGGAKMETKIPLIKEMLAKADCLLIGGGVANTCLWANGFKIGDSIVEKQFKKEALALWKNEKVILPVDFVIGTANGKKVAAVDLTKKFKITEKGMAIYDIGPKTVSMFAAIIKEANTLVWNGAMGMFEQPAYAWGGKAVARLFAARAKGRAFGAVGGGETVEILKKLNLLEDIDLVSTGGGAMLEFLSGKKLPGVKAVES